MNSNVLGNACSVLGVTFLRSIVYGSRTCQNTSQAINRAAHRENNNHYHHDYKEENEFYLNCSLVNCHTINILNWLILVWMITVNIKSHQSLVPLWLLITSDDIMNVHNFRGHYECSSMTVVLSREAK